MNTLSSFLINKLNEVKGEHDKSKTYDDLYKDVEKSLSRWGAGPVYGWRGDKGIAFSVSKGKNVKKDDWIVIYHDRRSDSLLITLSQFGTDDPDQAKDYREYVYAGEEPDVIDELLGI
jgi:hypothetical protein